MNNGQIPLNGIHGTGKVALVDVGNIDVLSGISWYVDSKGYVRRRFGPSTSFWLHRVVTGAIKGDIVDHINGNKLDNRISNLRICSQSVNLHNPANKRMAGHYSSVYKGVSWHKPTRNWRARIKIKGRSISLGYFSDEKTADEAHRKAVVMYIKSQGFNV